jgi:GT2 family glycosyltransferase
VKSIQSALDQDYANKEVAVFDDASTDSTPLLRDGFPQVRWQRVEKNVGYLAARNQLMRETDADLYFSLDDDAWFVRGDEISVGVAFMASQNEIAAVAYDILSPDSPKERDRSAPYTTHCFVGCGHLLRLSAVKEVNFYTPNPGHYGAEEKDLCLKLLDRGHELVYLPGVHVWHAKSEQARDLAAQHRSGVCNDIVFAFRRCPLPMVLWLLPGKFVSHLRFAVTNGFVGPCLRGMKMFFEALPALTSTREPVSSTAFREFRRRSRAIN